MAKEVRIELTAAQKSKIKEATGKSMGEIRVTRLGKNLAVAPAAEIGAKDLSSGDLSSGDLSSGDLSSGDLSSGDLSSGDLSSGDLSSSDLKAQF